MKSFKFVLVFGIVCLLLNFSKGYAIGCSANCRFSSCLVTGCSGPAACGCYFGLALCKCDEVGSTKSTKLTLNPETMREFQVYAISSGNTSLINLSNLLFSITIENYDEKFNYYKSEVENLDETSLSLLKSFLGLE